MLAVYYYLIAGFGISQMEYITAFILLLLKQMNIHMYKFKYDIDSYGDVLTVIGKESTTSAVALYKSKQVPAGFFLSKYAIGYIDACGWYSINDVRITIITTPAYYKQITTLKEVVFNETKFEDLPITTNNSIKIFTRFGCYVDFGYSSMTLNVKNLKALPSQEPIIKSVSELYNSKRQITIFIDGVPGSGKSSIGYLVAKELNGSFCHTFNPTDPGDSFSRTVNQIRDSESPDDLIVIVLEEVDVLLKNIHTGSIKENYKIPTSVKDKASWASFLDDMFFYPNIILILTSNKSKSEIDLLDPAYLRKGRIGAYFTLDTPILD